MVLSVKRGTSSFVVVNFFFSDWEKMVIGKRSEGTARVAKTWKDLKQFSRFLRNTENLEEFFSSDIH